MVMEIHTQQGGPDVEPLFQSKRKQTSVGFTSVHGSLGLRRLHPVRGSRYLIIKELELKDHDYYGFWGLSP